MRPLKSPECQPVLLYGLRRYHGQVPGADPGEGGDGFGLLAFQSRVLAVAPRTSQWKSPASSSGALHLSGCEPSWDISFRTWAILQSGPFVILDSLLSRPELLAHDNGIRFDMPLSYRAPFSTAVRTYRTCRGAGCDFVDGSGFPRRQEQECPSESRSFWSSPARVPSSPSQPLERMVPVPSVEIALLFGLFPRPRAV